MIQEITLQENTTDWINFLIETIRSWWMKSSCSSDENYFLIN